MSKRDEARKAMTLADEMIDLKAHQTGNIKHFLTPYFLFRCYIVFKNGKKVHLYGNEHQCTYNQLRYGRFENIPLNREKGYTDLIDLVEKRYSGKYTVAKIYRREPGTKDFNILCRHYDSNGQLLECQDPLIPEEQKILILFYYIHSGKVIVTPTDPAGENFKIDL